MTEKSPLESTHETSSTEKASDESREEGVASTGEWWKTGLQITIPYLIAASSTISVGVLLQRAESTSVFQNLPAILVMVPALMGMKANVDMCMASRLSTLTHLGRMWDTSETARVIAGNLALVQIQAIVAALVVALFATLVSALQGSLCQWENALVLCTSSVCNASISSILLDLAAVGAIFLAQKWGVDPDNMATPLVCSIGEVLGFYLLLVLASRFFECRGSDVWIMIVTLGTYIFLVLPSLFVAVRRNPHVRSIFFYGWVPILSALLISSCAGIILTASVKVFADFAIYQPMINGIGGNLASVHASRITSRLYQTAPPGLIPEHQRICLAPWGMVSSDNVARYLLFLGIAGQAVFAVIAEAAENRGAVRQPPEFTSTYVAMSTIQILLLLYLAHVIVFCTWKLKLDPDSTAIPFLTAIGDLSGTSLLALGFLFLKSIGISLD